MARQRNVQVRANLLCLSSLKKVDFLTWSRVAPRGAKGPAVLLLPALFASLAVVGGELLAAGCGFFAATTDINKSVMIDLAHRIANATESASAPL